MSDEKWHGTGNGYNYHKCRCDRCKQANRDRATKFRERKKALRVEEDGVLVAAFPPHGSRSRYINHSCRCAECTKVHKDYCNEYYDKNKEKLREKRCQKTSK